ncbi:cyanoexosortase A system-associated protein [Leptolyngbya boryana CZ1]|uniref:Cyanoexosortase A system-associated protein n=1 Tax=Leptolyngbya boryana CZ1 TaxID=3060204 RepID=A0AA96WPN8_LEPBY|nr:MULTISPECIES: cyanoexosortase A system-associated protein [Leptolyngbya]MBD1855435.1 cyanoexosortase A system-associated protein [Leptolyngbya sp. FACHB-1624]MBN8565005.1 cyanoexosortase A system-associated protein [Leptolyngbya sp. UWPOB_LEPTO1]WNZ43378.1 cyanoexosortase A system-associated protein [Leptolyngbya boryana CZ1]
MTSHSRSVFLKTIALSVTLTLLYVVVKPTSSPPANPEASLPNHLSLPGWEAQKTQSIEPSPSNSKYNRIVSGQRYLYRQGDRSLQIAVRYVVETEGDIGQFIADTDESWGKTPISFEDRQSTQGFYRLFTQQNQAYLQSCLNLNGHTTVTQTQFRQNAYRQALQPEQWLNWLISQRPLLERRCFWIQISTPVVEQNIHLTHATLEQSWKTLVSSWRSD